MLDPTTQQIGVGGVVAVVLVSVVMRFLPAFMAALKNGKNGKHQSGALSPEEWEGRMRRMHKESEEKILSDIRNMMSGRNEEIRRIVRDEIQRLK